MHISHLAINILSHLTYWHIYIVWIKTIKNHPIYRVIAVLQIYFGLLSFTIDLTCQVHHVVITVWGSPSRNTPWPIRIYDTSLHGISRILVVFVSFSFSLSYRYCYLLYTDIYVIRGLFVNYWDTACSCYTPRRKVVQMWYNHIATSVYNKYRRHL